VFTKLIPRNTTIPTHKSQIFSTAADGQSTVDIHVLQGEREFAASNKTLGRFQLGGIAPAPRGIPQIEVTFDIDANGIVHVTALDKGTGKSQALTITSSSNLSESDIDKAVKEAEEHAEEDKQRKAMVDTKNDLDHMIFSVEKFIKESGDKLTDDDKAKCESEIEEAKKHLDSENIEELKNALNTLRDNTGEIFGKLYQQQAEAGQGGCGADGEGCADGCNDGNCGNTEFDGKAE